MFLNKAFRSYGHVFAPMSARGRNLSFLCVTGSLYQIGATLLPGTGWIHMRGNCSVPPEFFRADFEMV